jgi:integrase
MKEKINFTKATILSLPIPQGNKISYFYDKQVNGLGIMLFSSGTKTFFLYKRINGRPDKIKLGRFPDITIEQARKAAYSLINDISQGIDPKKEKLRSSNNITFKDFFNEYIEKHAKLHKKTWQEDIDKYERLFSSLENKKINNIEKSMIIELHSTISKNRGIYSANRALMLLHTVFNKAIEWGIEITNPCTGIKKFKEKSRERFLQIEELPKFFAALNAELNETLKDFFYISLFTGARKGNVLTMQWQDISFERAIWHVKDTKNSESYNIHLSEEALKILHRRFKNKNCQWVFPSNTSKTGHLVEPKSAWKRLLKRAEIKDLRIHDLRRTLGSWQAATGANSYVIGKSLGHKTQQATAIYARLNLDPVRDSVNKATSAMLEFKKLNNI